MFKIYLSMSVCSKSQCGFLLHIWLIMHGLLLQRDIKGLIVALQASRGYEALPNKNTIDFADCKKTNKTVYYMTLFSRDLGLLFIHKQRRFQQLIFNKQSKQFSTYNDFFFIKGVFHKQIFFLHQGRFPRSRAFLLSRTFCTSRKFFLHHENFPQAIIFISWRMPCTSKYYFSIREVFHTQMYFYDHKILFKVKYFSLRKNLYPYDTKHFM